MHDGTGRMTILDVSEGTLVNDHNATVQNTWNIIVDDYIEAADVDELVRDPADSVPKARVAHTDRRAPWDPLVEYNQLTQDSTYNANTGTPWGDMVFSAINLCAKRLEFI